MIEIIEHDTVRELRLNRPPVNALNVPLINALSDAIETGIREADAVVLSGRPGMFSAGLDVPALLQLGRADAEQFVRSFFGLMEIVARSPIPIASAITGHCPAGGTVIVVFTDYRVMCKGKFLMGLNEVKVGLGVPTSIFNALARWVGRKKAERLTVSGQLITPAQAFDMGLVDEVKDDAESTVKAAINWCNKLVRSSSPSAVMATREVARADMHAIFDNFGEEDIANFVDGWFAPETQAGLKRLVEKLGKK